MARIYSTDLRDRVLAFIRSGHSRREAARHFAVSPSFAVKLAARERRTGSSAPDRRGRQAGHGKLAPVMGFPITRLQAEPDITMPAGRGAAGRTCGHGAPRLAVAGAVQGRVHI